MGTYSDLLQSKPTTSEPNSTTERSSSSKTGSLSDKKDQTQTAERFSERKTERLEPSPTPLPYKRRTKRYSFEFYDDQIMAIKRLVYEANLSGENISQSDIVRTALDEYLKKKEN
ncbi:MAG: hypothetical protein H0X31_02130 [Nostocaceae cyanobacterium]|nr:hypothetical protein [Nostocaceae cyanobacterium]